MMAKLIPGCGPYADLAFIGEAPAREEELKGEPFVGKSGEYVNRALRAFDLTRDDVRIDNVVPYRQPKSKFPQGAAGWELLRKHWDYCNESVQNAKVVVACGAWALRRLTGMANVGISAWHGSIIRGRRIVDSKGNRVSTPIIVPVLHPAGLMRDPRRVMLNTWLKEIRWAVELSRDPTLYKPVHPTIIPVHTESDLDPLFDATHIVLDTEFDIETNVPYLLGLANASEPTTVYSVREPKRLVEKLTTLLSRSVTALVMHHAPADTFALRAVGIETTPVIFDTLQMHSLVEPDLPHPLSFVARTTLPDVSEWKHQSESDIERYNAKDVMNTGRSAHPLHDELEADGGLQEAYFQEVMPNLERAALIERLGIRVDTQKREEIREQLHAVVQQSEKIIREHTRNKVKTRAMHLYDQVEAIEKQIENTLAYAYRKAKSMAECEHKLTFKVVPRNDCVLCADAFEAHVLPARAKVKPLRANRIRLFNLAREIESKGFRIGNDNDMRWYVTEVLGRTTGKRTSTRKVAVDATSLERLFAKGESDPVIEANQRAKHAQKWESTFIDIPIDERSFAHPPVRLHGCGTGRPASGRETHDDKWRTDEAFNAFNIPKPLRAIFVPAHEGWKFLSVDIKDMEGRLVALDCGDERLCDLYARGVDVHASVAGELFGVEPDLAENTPITIGGATHSARDWGKRVRHGVAYGMGSWKMAYTLNIPEADARRFRRAYLDMFPRIEERQHEIIEEVFGPYERLLNDKLIFKSRGTNIMFTEARRRRRYLGSGSILFKDLLSQRPQSHGASIWYRGWDRICEPRSLRLRCSSNARMVLGTYDSYDIECPESEIASVSKWVTETLAEPYDFLRNMRGAKLMPLTFPVDVQIGDNLAFGKQLVI